MTRYHYFNTMYPEVAKEVHQGYQDMSSTMWYSFTKITGLSRFFKFTPDFNTAPDQGAPAEQGITKSNNHPL